MFIIYCTRLCLGEKNTIFIKTGIHFILFFKMMNTPLIFSRQPTTRELLIKHQYQYNISPGYGTTALPITPQKIQYLWLSYSGLMGKVVSKRIHLALPFCLVDSNVPLPSSFFFFFLAVYMRWLFLALRKYPTSII